MKGNLTLRVLLFQENSQWIAQVLEKDMAAHGPDPYAALAAVQLVLQAHVNFDTLHQRQPLSKLSQAPNEFWQAYDSAEPLPPPETHGSLESPRRPSSSAGENACPPRYALNPRRAAFGRFVDQGGGTVTDLETLQEIRRLRAEVAAMWRVVFALVDRLEGQGVLAPGSAQAFRLSV